MSGRRKTPNGGGGRGRHRREGGKTGSSLLKKLWEATVVASQVARAEQVLQEHDAPAGTAGAVVGWIKATISNLLGF